MRPSKGCFGGVEMALYRGNVARYLLGGSKRRRVQKPEGRRMQSIPVLEIPSSMPTSTSSYT